jgi:hypothetical protein
MQVIIKYQEYVHQKQCNKQKFVAKLWNLWGKIWLAVKLLLTFSENYIGVHECMDDTTLGRTIVKT